MNNKEQLLYFFLQGKINLSSYDHKFMQNLQTILHQNNRITSNQAKLFDTLVKKYSKQLQKQELDSTVLLELPWKAKEVESTSDYTGADVRLSDDGEQLIIRVPFNKAFIAGFRNSSILNTFVWNKEQKRYFSPFSTFAFKLAVTCLPKYFTTVNYSEELSSILREIKKYDAEIWDPTLVKMGESYIVAGWNEQLASVLPNTLELNTQTLHALSLLGIKIQDQKVLKDSPELNFAYNQNLDVDIDDIKKIAIWLRAPEYRDYKIFLNKPYTINKKIHEEIRQIFSNAGIVVSPSPLDRATLSTSAAPNEKNILITTNLFTNANHIMSLKKIIRVKNSRPVDVR